MLDRYFSLKGKVAMVTGASRGLGKAMALGMAEAGADVILVSRNETLMNETALQIDEFGRKALVEKADIVDPQDIINVVNKGIRHFGSIDILVNNAGLSGRSNYFRTIPIPIIRRLSAPICTALLALPGMSRST